MHRPAPQRIVAAFLLIGGMATGSRLYADVATQREGLKPLAQQIVDVVVKDQQQHAVAVGDFIGPPQLDSNAGPGVGEDLKSLLDELQPGLVNRKAEVTVSGRYAFVEQKNNPQLKVIEVTALVTDRNNREVGHLSTQINSTKVIAQMLGATASLPPDGTKEERNKELSKSISNPQFALDGTRIRSKGHSQFAVELLVKPLEDQPRRQAVPRRPKVVDGEPFVDINLNELYEVKVYNESPRDVAIALSIDGLDMFHFTKDRDAKGRPKFSHFIVHPKGFRDAGDSNGPESNGTLTIVGWHKSVAGTENFLSFLVTGYGRGAVSQAGLKARGKVGVIHVQLSNCRPLAAGEKSAGGNETGFGPPRTVRQKAVRYEIEPPHEFVTVRYTRP